MFKYSLRNSKQCVKPSCIVKELVCNRDGLNLLVKAGKEEINSLEKTIYGQFNTQLRDKLHVNRGSHWDDERGSTHIACVQG